jgi:hypothetical protein
MLLAKSHQRSIIMVGGNDPPTVGNALAKTSKPARRRDYVPRFNRSMIHSNVASVVPLRLSYIARIYHAPFSSCINNF